MNPVEQQKDDAIQKYSIAETGPRISSLLGTLLKEASLELQFEIAEGDHRHPELEDPEIVVQFSGPDVPELLANKAELLLALEHLTMEALRMPSEDHSRVCFDANDHRLLRIEELRLSAMTAAESVKKSKRPFHFSPMSSRERRIIHLSLRNETAVRSESTGTGPYRQVVIVPAEMTTIPAPIIPPPPRRDGPGGGDRRDRGGRDRGRRDQERGGPGRSGPPRRRF